MRAIIKRITRRRKRPTRNPSAGLGRAVPIPGGARDGDGEPYETHVLPDEPLTIDNADLEAIRRQQE